MNDGDSCEPGEVRRRTLAVNLKRLRESKRLTRRELSSMIGIKGDDSSIRGWENAEHWPTERNLLRLAEALDVPVAVLTTPSSDSPYIPVEASLVETHEELPDLLVKLLHGTTRSLKGIRIAAPYATASVQTEFRAEVARRLQAGTLFVQRAEIVYGLTRLKELLFNVLHYDSRRYQVKAYCPGLDEAVPGIGCYSFDDRVILLGAYWAKTPPPPHSPGLLLSGDPCRSFFRAYWDEIWRRGVWLNEKGAQGLDAIRDIAIRLGLDARDWPKFVEEAEQLRMEDGASPLF